MKLISKTDKGPTLVGKIVLTVAVIVSIIPYGYFFSWIFFITGIAFIWSGDLKRSKKWYWTIIPLIIWYPIMMFFFVLLPTLLN